MKVLFVSNDPTIFDVKSDTHKRMQAYASTIGELHIVSPASKDAYELHEGTLFLHPIHANKFFRVFALASLARKIIHKYEIEIVSAQDPFEHGLSALRATRGTKAKLHVQVHTDFLSPWFVKTSAWNIQSIKMLVLNKQRRKIADRVLPKADGIRVVSDRIKMSLIARYGKNVPEPTVIPIKTDTTVPTPVPLMEHSFGFTLISVGRLEAEKRVGDILKALKIVTKKYSMVGLFIVGDGRERDSLESLVQTLGLAKKVSFLGERSDARALMANANVFIQASAYEGYGRTLIEAALAETPIITTDVGIVGEVLVNQKSALVCSVGDTECLARAIEKLIEENNIRRSLRENALQVANTHIASVGDVTKRITDDFAHTIANI